MPCTDSRDSYNCNEVQERLDNVTNLLCGLCRHICAIGYGGLINSNSELVKWYEAHQAADEERNKAEQYAQAQKTAREKALAKLTTDERELLGL